MFKEKDWYKEMWELVSVEDKKYLEERLKYFDPGQIGKVKKDEQLMVKVVAEDLQDLYATIHVCSKFMQIKLEDYKDVRKGMSEDELSDFMRDQENLRHFIEMCRATFWWSIANRYNIHSDLTLGIRNGFAIVLSKEDSLYATFRSFNRLKGLPNGEGFKKMLDDVFGKGEDDDGEDK